MIRICYVYLKRLPAAQADFATHVPVRMAHLLGTDAEVHVLYSGAINEGRLRRAGVRTHRYDAGGVPGVRQLRIAAAVARVARQERIDLFQNVWAHHALLPVLAGARRAGAAVLARVVGVPIGGGSGSGRAGLRRRAGLALERRVLRSVDAVHVVSHSLADVYAARGVEAGRMVAISQGCDTDLFRPAAAEDSAAQTRTSAEPRLLFVGRLARWKGVDTLLRSLRILADDGRVVRCTIAGAGAARGDLERLAADLELAAVVEFVGEVAHERLPELMRAADALVLPSRSEGLPNVVLESMACGTPVIATDVGAVPELLASGGGWTVPVADAAALAAALRRLADRPELGRESGRRGRAYVLEHHSFDAVRARYLALFGDLVAGGRA